MSSTIDSTTATPPPTTVQDSSKKKDWVKITGIVIAIIGGVLFASAFFCSRGTFPKELLGGKFGVASVFAVGICILSIGGAIFFFRWIRSKEEQSENSPNSPAAT